MAASALLVVVVTWVATKLVHFLLDHEILPRLDLRTGVPIAISTIVGYVLVVTGFVLATAALGIDLTKVTLLAGAVGIGTVDQAVPVVVDPVGAVRLPEASRIRGAVGVGAIDQPVAIVVHAHRPAITPIGTPTTVGLVAIRCAMAGFTNSSSSGLDVSGW